MNEPATKYHTATPEPAPKTKIKLDLMVAANLGTAGEWTMTKKRMQDALCDKEISKATYVKWAIRYDYGEFFSAQIDVNQIINDWSFYDSKRDKAVELDECDILAAIAKMTKEGAAIITGHQLELNLISGFRE